MGFHEIQIYQTMREGRYDAIDAMKIRDAITIQPGGEQGFDLVRVVEKGIEAADELPARASVTGSAPFPMNKDALTISVGTIFSSVWHSKTGALTAEEEDRLHEAIATIRKEWDASDLHSALAHYVCECAHEHLAALNANPHSKPEGAEALKSDCKLLLHYLTAK